MAVRDRAPLSVTPRQQAVLDFARRYIGERGYAPGIREIMGGCGISSTSVVDYNLRALERAGLLTREPETARSIRLVEPYARYHGVCPHCGHPLERES